MVKNLSKVGSNQKGFTLVELLIAVTIIAVLTVIGVVVYAGTQRDARNARRRGDIEAINKALEVHYNTTANQYCPTSPAGSYCAPVGTWFSAAAIPVDPSTAANYTGLPANAVTTYTVCATLETPPGGTYCRSNQQ